MRKLAEIIIYYENNLFGEIDIKNNNLKEIIPIYKETKGVSSLFLNTLIKKVIREFNTLKVVKDFDPLPENVLNDLHLPSLDKAYLYIHLPKGKNLKRWKNNIGS